ncbi:KAP family P-loop NTPase fold protein [Salinibacterium sp. PAMC 21357]|uniref:KAP family P-loop NTPase fold protein n=1 Tax=Salinibacterium sp. PAMC 21357 TaxID=1112215 RepID=UPI00028A0E17|nr:P-loop NTPase fold protein [Salinibacterium sp. PAMC 21357]
MTISENPVWSDSPRSKADIGGRAAFAAAVAARINAAPMGSSSTVYGLVGPWGSGKTTLLRDIEDRVTGETVWFSPWSAADVAAITSEFVAALSEAFPQAKDLKSRLLGYSRFGVPALKAIPFAGEAVSGVAAKAFEELTPPSAWHTEFQHISEQIQHLGKQVLVIVDDVDRLDANDLRALLRVIRLLGRFNNVHYLIAYDQMTIDQLLTSSGMVGRSSDFMEKIVQYPFEIPPTPAAERRRWARASVTVAVPEHAQLSDDFRAPTESLIGILAAGIETPRSAERLREQLAIFAGLASQAELDGLDFVAISWLRIAHHNVWEHVRSHREVFCGWRNTSEDATRSEQQVAISELVSASSAKAVWDAVLFLFDSSNELLAPVGRKRGIRSPRYFDRYFLLGLAEDDVSDAQTDAAVEQIIAGTSTSAEIEIFGGIILGDDAERAALALRVGRDSRRDDTPSIAMVDFLSAQRQDLDRTNRLHDFRQAGLERWLAREVALALASGDLDVEHAVAQFGYELLIASAHGIRGVSRGSENLIKAAFSGVAREWTETAGKQTLDEVLARPEMYSMLSFCAWLGSDIGRGVLERSISGAEDLVRVAEKFVTYSETLGYRTEYDVRFREAAFRFAVGDELSAERLAELPDLDDSLDYEITDRLTRDLEIAELRDYVVRQLRGLALSDKVT